MTTLLILTPISIYLLIGVFFAAAVRDLIVTQVDELDTAAYLLTLVATTLLWPLGFTKKR